MQLLKRKKSRQEKLTDSDIPALNGINQDDKATTDSTQNESSDDISSVSNSKGTKNKVFYLGQ